MRYSQVLDELVRAADVNELAEPDLRDDSAELAARSRDTVRGGPVARRERLPRYDEGGRVRAEVLEEVREAVEERERLGAGRRRGELVVPEAHDDEEDGEHDEAHELDGLAAPAVDEEEGHPVTGDETGDDEDEVTDSDIVEILVNGKGTSHVLARSAETNCGKNDGGVQSETVEGNLIIKMSVTLSDR